MPKRLLIVGYGFLGRAIKPTFTASGWQVACLNRSGSHGATACDLSSRESVSGITGEYDLVIHCAASGGGDLDSYRDIYLQGCKNLIERFPQTPLVFTSSTSVYPQSDHSEVTELSPAEPQSPRAIILRDAENEVLSADGIVARLTGLYGQGRCHVLKNFLAGESTLDGEGDRVMNFVHRDDVATALLILAERGRGGEIYNVNGGHASQLEVYQSLALHFDLPMPSGASFDIPRKRGNTSKKVSSDLIKELGWSPEYTGFLSLALACSLK
ncbi:MAG: NAD-dependent epimerase/dehydratase family protein [Akkermansiaceae bacterium]